MSFLRSDPPSQVMLDDLRIQIKNHPRARHLTLRQDTRTAQFILTKPRRTSHKAAVAFIQECRTWIESQKTKHPEPNLLESGTTICLEGRALTIKHIDAAGIEIYPENDQLIVKCRPPRLARTVQRFLIQRAENLIIPMAYEKAAGLKKPIKSVRFRDTSSRWGSCTYDGKLSFSWRLIMAPMEVIDYLVAHEVAHLEHMNHSERFWGLCRKLTAHTTFGKHWLKINGDRLYQIHI